MKTIKLINTTATNDQELYKLLGECEAAIKAEGYLDATDEFIVDITGEVGNYTVTGQVETTGDKLPAILEKIGKPFKGTKYFDDEEEDPDKVVPVATAAQPDQDTTVITTMLPETSIQQAVLKDENEVPAQVAQGAGTIESLYEQSKAIAEGKDGKERYFDATGVIAGNELTEKEFFDSMIDIADKVYDIVDSEYDQNYFSKSNGRDQVTYDLQDKSPSFQTTVDEISKLLTANKVEFDYDYNSEESLGSFTIKKNPKFKFFDEGEYPAKLEDTLEDLLSGNNPGISIKKSGAQFVVVIPTKSVMDNTTLGVAELVQRLGVFGEIQSADVNPKTSCYEILYKPGVKKDEFFSAESEAFESRPYFLVSFNGSINHLPRPDFKDKSNKYSDYWNKVNKDNDETLSKLTNLENLYPLEYTGASFETKDFKEAKDLAIKIAKLYNYDVIPKSDIDSGYGPIMIYALNDSYSNWESDLNKPYPLDSALTAYVISSGLVIPKGQKFFSASDMSEGLELFDSTRRSRNSSQLIIKGSTFKLDLVYAGGQGIYTLGPSTVNEKFIKNLIETGLVEENGSNWFDSSSNFKFPDLKLFNSDLEFKDLKDYYVKLSRVLYLQNAYDSIKDAIKDEKGVLTDFKAYGNETFIKCLQYYFGGDEVGSNLESYVKSAKIQEFFDASTELSEDRLNQSLEGLITDLEASEHESAKLFIGSVNHYKERYPEAKTVGDVIKNLEEFADSDDAKESSKFKMFLGGFKGLVNELPKETKTFSFPGYESKRKFSFEGIKKRSILFDNLPELVIKRVPKN